MPCRYQLCPSGPSIVCDQREVSWSQAYAVML
ncbi:MAG: hypothetical protein BWY76_00337 [bacterium ADurb.Bin429]|nr:MAG: hypothetical protein BWY76_00337 [bacterium ADurb.Bin429]